MINLILFENGTKKKALLHLSLIDKHKHINIKYEYASYS
jgi:hypothetical protein